MHANPFSSLRPSFAGKGYAHVPAFLSTDELADVRANLQRYQEQIAPNLEPYRVLYDVDGDVRFARMMVNMDKADTFFAKLLNGPKARGLAAALLGEEVVPQTLEYFDKGPRIGKSTPAHQDGYYFCLVPNHAVTLWVALDDCDQDNGCMSYVIGSHQRGVIDHAASGVVGFSQGIAEASYEPAGLFVAAGNAGDCFAHHSLTIHMAGANRSDRHRRSLGLVHYGVSARLDEKAFARYQSSVAEQRKSYPTAASAR